jgi:RND family efflux transporter MFP subunit
MTELKDDLAALRIERAPESRVSTAWLKWVVLLVLVGGASAAAYGYFTRERPVEVEIVAVTQRAPGRAAQVANANGYVVARRRATVSSKITGKVVEVNVEEGMAVKEGQILARLDDVMYRAALALAEAQAEASRRGIKENEVRLEEAKLHYNRFAALLKEGIVTQADVDTAKAGVDSIVARIAALNQQTKVSERQIDLAQTDLDNTIIRAPFSGIAISKDAQPGEMVSPVSAGGGFTRTGICTMVDMRSLEIEVDVNESYISRIEAGQDAVARLNAYPDWEIPTRVITIIPAGDRQKATVLVRIGFKELDPRIRPDMGVQVQFLRPKSAEESAAAGRAAAQEARPVALVPKDAVVTENGQSHVFVVGSNDTVERRAITTAGSEGDRLEVTGGLRAGERVVLSPPPTLQSGAKITAKPRT